MKSGKDDLDVAMLGRVTELLISCWALLTTKQKIKIYSDLISCDSKRKLEETKKGQENEEN